jgi:hypothetical protein
MAPHSAPWVQVLRRDRYPVLHSLVTGEGLVNDGAAIALLAALKVRAPLMKPAPHIACVAVAIQSSTLEPSTPPAACC